MSDERHYDRTDRVLDQANEALPQVDPDVQRAIDAVRESTPSAVVTMLEERGLFDAMLEKMQLRFRGRPLGSIHREELVQIARDSVDETMGIEPLSRPSLTFPEPEVGDPDVALLTAAEDVVRAWRDDELDAARAVRELRELHGETD